MPYLLTKGRPYDYRAIEVMVPFITIDETVDEAIRMEETA